MLSSLLQRHNSPAPDLITSKLYNEDTFYAAFEKDLKNCHSEVIIETPFITNRRVSQLLGIFEKLKERKVRVTINTRDPEEHNDNYMREEAVEFDYLPDKRVLTLQSDKPFAEKEDAFTLIFNEYGAKVYGGARAIVGPFEAEDVAQDTFLTFWLEVDGFSQMNKAQLGGLLYRMAKNTSLNVKRKQKNAPRLGDLAKPVPLGDPVTTQEFREDMASLLGMPKTEHEALMLRTVMGFSRLEIAERQNVSPIVAKSRVQRARVRARSILRSELEPAQELVSEEEPKAA